MGITHRVKHRCCLVWVHQQVELGCKYMMMIVPEKMDTAGRWDVQVEMVFFLPSAGRVCAMAMHVKRQEIKMTGRLKKPLKLKRKKTASWLTACVREQESQEWRGVTEKVIDFI